MLGSISPVGEAARDQRWWVTATAYTLASTATGGLLGVVLGGLGSMVAPVLSSRVRMTALGIALLVAAATDAGLAGVRLPTWHRQVDERWLGTYRGWVYGLGFGGQLGAGVVTIVTSAATYVVVLAAALSGSWPSGLLVGATFGLVRAVPLLLLAPIRTPDGLWTVTRRVAAAEPRVRRVTVGAQTLLGLVVLAGVLV